MPIRVESPQGEAALTDFLLFHDRVYESRSARWPSFVPLQLPALEGRGPFAQDRTFRPFLAVEGGRPLARAVGMIDRRYQRHWREPLGHVVLFEALPDAREATRRVMDAACEWLGEQGAVAARVGSPHAPLDMPFRLDDDGLLPPMGLRQNPGYMNTLVKDAGFETERGWVDYRITVTPELVARWESARAAARRGGIDLVPLHDVPESQRVPAFTALWDECFAEHWGVVPSTEDEFALLLELQGPTGVLDTSVMAYRDGKPIGVLWVAPESTMMAVLDPDRTLRDEEKVNFLGIGVHRDARGQGVNLAMAANAYLEIVRHHGVPYLSYTLVLDDNWPSRRTAEKLGAYVCASYVTYRRNLRR